ncbi:MAG: isoprenylcysteine carboxylmethyltransferase family protein [Propionibacteriaceae bacterium]|nr:isoprenylcysteine carboxylmethyltransferase family protein [Propionibacteriaceae bacterium]
MMVHLIATVGLVILVAMVGVRAVILLKKGVRAVVFGAGDKSDFLLAVPVLFLVYTLTGLPLPSVLTRQAPGSAILGWIGIVLCVAALIWFGLTLVTFGGSFRVGIDDTTTDSLITSGPFGLSRNPLYLGFDVYFLALAFVTPNLASVIIVILFAVMMHRQIVKEERFLTAHYGQQYAEYAKQVRRYL